MHQLERKHRTSTNLIRTFLPVPILVLYYIGWNNELTLVMGFAFLGMLGYLITVIGSKNHYHGVFRLDGDVLQIRQNREKTKIKLSTISEFFYKARIKKRGDTTYEIPLHYEITTENETYMIELDEYQEESIMLMNNRLQQRLGKVFSPIVFYRGERVEIIEDQHANREFVVLEEDIENGQ